MQNPMPPVTSGVLAVSSSSDISEVWTDGVCPVHVLAMVLSLDIKFGLVSSTSLTLAGSWMMRSSPSTVWTDAAAQNLWYWLYPGASLKVDTLSLGPSGTVLVKSFLSTFH